MKKIIIGSVFTLSGIIVVVGIIMAAAWFAPSITSWSGSKLWFAIFGAPQYGSDVVQSLFLGVPFVAGVVLAGAGLLILLVEYFRRDNF